MSLHSNFKLKLKIQELKTKLSKKLKAYTRQKSIVELATLRFDNVPKKIEGVFMGKAAKCCSS